MVLWLVILSLLVLFSESLAQVSFCEKSCPVNEVFSYNVSQCQNTCFNQDFNKTSNCVTSPGCVCKAGFIRNHDTYKCVPTSSCLDKRSSKQCADNEFYSDCDAGCPRTCLNRNAVIRCRCGSGCTCRTGYVRSDVNFQCIPINFCQSCPAGYVFSQVTRRCELNCKQCQQDEIYKTCGSPCEATCDNPNKSNVVCTQACREGCFCDNGFVRNQRSGLCILPKNCPNSRCPENESFRCGNPWCETNCQTIGQKCTKYPKHCLDKCYCANGYVRALDGGQCVSLNQCPIINNSNNRIQ